VTATDYDKFWIDDYPTLGTEPVPTEPCTSAEYYGFEQERLFPKVWLKVGQVEDVPNPGDFFVQDIAVCHASVIVVRAEDGAIRAFHNVCSHRGNKLVWENTRCGTTNAFRCRFHGWSYGTDGSLIAVPDEKMFYRLQRANCGLTPVAADVWEGFIFINLDPNPRETLKEFLGEMGDHLSGFPYQDFPTRYIYRAELKSNWKVCLDAFSEAYHAVFIHQQTVGAINITKENPMHHPLSVRLYERHRSAVVQGNPSFKPTPTGKIASSFGLTSMERGRGMETLPPHINPERRNDFNFDLNVIFPSFLVHVRPGEYFTHQFWPLGPDRTLWEGINYLPRARNAGERFSQEYSHLMRRNAWLEDTSTMEATYAGLATGALRYFMLSDPEILVRHGYKVLEDHVGFYRDKSRERRADG
jgi:phenylpropionate dioxygenase-like ring-hydroxylating dioxygenase large terminal subunit